MYGLHTHIAEEVNRLLGAVAVPLTPTPVTPYTVRVTAAELNIRKGSGVNFAVVGCIRDKGVYTITEESAGWGKLKSGAGWINLSYTVKQ